MFKNYLKIAFRNIKRNKGYSFINITGLAIGTACFILMLLLVLDELSFDGFHKNADDIHRVIIIEENSNGLPIALTQAPLAAALKRDFPEIIEAACFNYGGGGLVKYGDKALEESYFTFTDPSFFKMFSFTFLKGNPQTALATPLGVVLSEKTAKKYFGEKNPLGEVLQIKNIANLTVTGVIRTPKNSSMEVEFVVSNQIYDRFGVDIKSWNRRDYTTFVLLQKNIDAKQLNTKIYGYFKKRWPDTHTRLTLQPLKCIYLYSNLSYEPLRTSSINLIYILLLLAIFILLIACVNFMNLSTARSAKRMKEVGLRKVVGANKRQLVRQFLGESVLYSLIALMFAVVLVELALPHLNQLSFKDMSLYRSLTPAMALGLMCIAVITGVIAGSYPAFFLSSFKPAHVLKGPKQKGAKGSVLRKILAVGQFSLSILLIIGTTVLYKQLHYIQHANLGYDKEQLVCVLMNADIKKSYNVVKNELLKNSGIISVTAALNLPNWRWPSFKLSNWEGKDTDKEIPMHHCSVDYDYFKTFKMKILQGRTFSREFPSDLKSAFIVNEEAVKQMEMKNPLGKYLHTWDHKGKIIGVVKNFHFDSFRNKINPLVIHLTPRETDYMILRVQTNNIPGTLNFIEHQWKSFAPVYPFRFTFMDERFNRMYVVEIAMGKVVSVFTVLAIFISCMGLFGLASFMTQQRTKEIGIRKALGASVPGIVQLLSKEFLKWVLLANFIAWPLAFLGMSNWLQIYAYRTGIGVWPFLLAGMLALLIAVLSVGSQSIKTAKTNPVEALRYE
jgi:ABC-type antimicrobial peptide transport system permease subunit